MITKAHVSGIGEQELHADGFFFFGCLLEVVVLHHGDKFVVCCWTFFHQVLLLRELQRDKNGDGFVLYFLQ
jgi:hypothetical protein